MATTPTVLRNAIDSAVSNLAPTKNYGNPTTLGISNVTGRLAEVFIYFAIPFPRGATILNATLSLVNQNAYAASTTWSVTRLAAAWSSSRITWNTRPAVTGTAVSVTKATAPAGTKWDFDVTAMMQTISNGAAWYGFKVSTTSNVYNWMYASENANVAFRPTLSISWADNPQAPTMLYPSGGRAVSIPKPVLQCNFVDVSGDTTMQSMQIQIDDASDFATPLFDSGTVATSVPQIDLSTTSFTGLTANQVVYWRARVQDGAGLWSDWSLPTTMTYITRGTLTITNPAVSPNNFVAESTPPISWTFATRTQKAYQVVVALDATPNKWLWTSGKITAPDTTVTIPEKVLLFNNVAYRLTVMVWDTIDREATPGDPIQYTATRTFTYQYDGTVAVVTGLTASAHAIYPHILLSWSRSTQPDAWDIYRDGKLIATAPGAQYFVSGTAYQYWDRLPSPKVVNTYTVIPVVNSKGAASSPTVTATPRIIGPTLSDISGNYIVILFNQDTDMSLTEETTVYAPAASGAPVIITQAERGFQGKVAGRLASFGGISAETFKANYKKLVRNNGQRLQLTIVNEAFEVILANATYKPVTRNEEVVYEVSFNFYQTDYVP